MKSFIDSCRVRGKGYFPSEGEAEDFAPALVLEVQLSLQSHVARHTGCNKTFCTTSNRNKHEAASHARAVTEARASKRQKKEPMFYIPHDDLLNFRATTETCKRRTIGIRRKIVE